MKQQQTQQAEIFWPKIVLKKWLNINEKESDFSADPDEGDSDTDSDDEEIGFGGRQSGFEAKNGDEARFDTNETSDTLPILRRQKSETRRAQYINTKDIRIWVGTWNVGGNLLPDDLDISGWLDTDNSADIYVLGLQEIVPLTAGNIFGAEDNRPVPKWEYIIRETLNRIQPVKPKFKSFSEPPSPSRFMPSDDILHVEDELLSEIDSDGYEDIYPLAEESNDFNEFEDESTSEIDFINSGASNCTENDSLCVSKEQNFQREFSSPKRLDRLNSVRMEDCLENIEASSTQKKGKLTKMLSWSDRMVLNWPEPPLNLPAQHVFERANPFKSVKSFRASKSFRTCSSFNPSFYGDIKGSLLEELDLEAIINRKRRSPFVRIVSKQMVGIFLCIWVRRSLRRHIQNLKVSSVGVGVMGYIGNKGSISVSMSIYQTTFCFICTHLTSGEKEGDEIKRNANVREIHRRTQFHSVPGIGFPKKIHDHERIIWFGDLNYRINLSYERTRDLISKKEWHKLVERDQLVQELRKGCTFDGWSEGTLNFPPTYKYESNSTKYCGEDPKAGRRTPAWCDRILSFGKGMRLLNYKRIEQMFSDHRPVTAIYMAEVEVFSHRKLQRALTITDAELESEEIIEDMGAEFGMNRLRFGESISDWER